MSEQIRIIIADDHPLFREGVSNSLAGESDITLVGEASTSEEAFSLTADILPDVLILDITMPGVGGIEIARRVSAALPVIQIIMLTASEDQDDLMKALKAGVRGYILKGISAKDLVNAVRHVASGGTYFSPEMASTLLLEFSKPNPSDPFSELTEREKQILKLVAKGLTNREIGEQIYLAEKTIKHYMTNILQKLHVRSRVEAALLVQKRELDK